MTPLFADSFYFLALLNPKDKAHEKARRYAARPTLQIVTTAWVLTEVADALSAPINRKRFLALYDALQDAPMANVLPATANIYERGISLYRKRPDKFWTLSDCISFLVMQEQTIKEALTGDKHFEQAGFIALLK